MGYALFTARKMSLQAKVNDYNAQLMKISNEETRLANQTAARQQVKNCVDNAQSTGSSVAKIGGAILGFATGGLIGASIGSSIGGAVAGIANAGIDQGQSMADEAYNAQMTAKQKALDTEKQRITTLLNAAQNELQQVEKAEESAIKNATPKYVA